jgi:GT2 family glycosyltransferase
MRFWICIPVHNRLNFTIECIKSLKKQSFKNFEIIICDDGSTDGTYEYVRKTFPDIRLLQGDGSLWWTGAINCCLNYILKENHGNEDFVLTLNNDIVLNPNYLLTLQITVEKYPGSIITSTIFDIKTKKLVDAGQRYSWLMATSKPINPQKDFLENDKSVGQVTHASGRGTLIPIGAFKKLGLYDEKKLCHYGADYDFSFRAARSGYKIIVSFDAEVFSHVEETGLPLFFRELSLKGFYLYLMDRKSPGNFKCRLWMTINNCPWYFMPTHLVVDLIRVFGSYFKRHILKTYKPD